MAVAKLEGFDDTMVFKHSATLRAAQVVPDRPGLCMLVCADIVVSACVSVYDCDDDDDDDDDEIERVCV